MQLVGSRVREARKRLGWTQQELADKVDVSLKSVTNWELEASPASQQNMRKLSESLGVEIPWLLGEEKINSRLESPDARRETAEVYGLREDMGGAGELPTQEKCRRHFEKVLATCDTPARLGWLWCELLEKFPLNKFRKTEP